jgi:hypothetical protein
MRSLALEGPPEGRITHKGGDSAKAQPVQEGERAKGQDAERAIERVDAALVVERGRRAREEEALGEPQLTDQADDVPIRGEPVVVESLQRPLPASSRKPAEPMT